MKFPESRAKVANGIGASMSPPNATAGTASEDEFSARLSEHKGIVCKIAHAYARNPEDWKDLSQEIILQLWKSYHRFDPRFKFSTWMYRVALNVAISTYRRERRRASAVVSIEEIVVEPASHPEQTDHDRHITELYRIIGQLDELNRALMLLYLDETSYRDIATILGISETNVSTKINRLKLRIKEQFIKCE
jgi:RNA polymerase sigma-70 factor (ECF subfamily)